MSYTYATFSKALAIEMVIPNANVQNVNFQAILPTLIDQAEQVCYRDLDLLAATGSQQFPTIAQNRYLNFTAATGARQILIAEDINIVLASGERVPMHPTSRAWIDAVYGGSQTAAQPNWFAMLTDTQIILAPWPDQVYNLEVIGKFRPAPLYSAPPNDGTQTTFLSSVLPDLFLAAAMVAASGYMKNFGAQADDVRMAMSWSTVYQQALASAKGEETRKKFHGWMALSSESNPPPTPPPPPPGG